MDMTHLLLAGALGLFFLLALLRIFRAPMLLALRILGNTILGFGALWFTQYTAIFTGISLGINLWNALIIAVLGLPGFAFLILTQWVLF